MANKVAQPMPASGMIWKSTINPGDGERVVVSVDGNGVVLFKDGGGCFVDYLTDDCRCIGIETAHGRVMVGERRTRRETWTIDAVINGEKVIMSCPEASRQYEMRAEAVATWPLVSPPSPQGAEAPKTTACPSCGGYMPEGREMCGSCRSDIGDSSYAARCPCGAPMPSFCVMCPGCAADEVMRRPREERNPEAWGTVTFGGASFKAKVVEVIGTNREADAAPIGVTRGKVSWDLTPAESGAYERAIEDCNIMIAKTICGPSADPREQGPGIARLPRPTVRPDVVVCAEWDERWGTP